MTRIMLCKLIYAQLFLSLQTNERCSDLLKAILTRALFTTNSWFELQRHQSYFPRLNLIQKPWQRLKFKQKHKNYPKKKKLLRSKNHNQNTLQANSKGKRYLISEIYLKNMQKKNFPRVINKHHKQKYRTISKQTNRNSNNYLFFPLLNHKLVKKYTIIPQSLINTEQTQKRKRSKLTI